MVVLGHKKKASKGVFWCFCDLSALYFLFRIHLKDPLIILLHYVFRRFFKFNRHSDTMEAEDDVNWICLSVWYLNNVVLVNFAR